MPTATVRADSATPSLPSFWLLHTGGWLAYGLAMSLSRLGLYDLRYMMVAKGFLMVSGFVLSLSLRYVYRPLIRRRTPLLAVLAVSVVASYIVSLAWTAADNYLTYEITVALGVREPMRRPYARCSGCGARGSPSCSSISGPPPTDSG